MEHCLVRKNSNFNGAPNDARPLDIYGQSANCRDGCNRSVSKVVCGDIKDSMQSRRVIISSRNKRRPSIRFPSRFTLLFLSTVVVYRGHTHDGHNSLREPMQPMYAALDHPQLSRSVHTRFCNARHSVCPFLLSPTSSTYRVAPDMQFQTEREIVTFFVSASPLRGESTTAAIKRYARLSVTWQRTFAIRAAAPRAEILVDLDFQPYVIQILDHAIIGKRNLAVFERNRAIYVKGAGGAERG